MRIVLSAATALWLVSIGSQAHAPKTLRVWVFADAHVGTDKGHGRESLADVIRQSETAPGFGWDIALDLGDMSGAHGVPKDAEGEGLSGNSPR